LQKNGRFGNHRKYESLLDEHTGKTIASYISWIGENHRHQDLFNYLRSQVGENPHILFETLYKSMEAVWRFGRTSKFDYLCMVGKLGLLDVEPGHPYLQDATGPLEGAGYCSEIEYQILKLLTLVYGNLRSTWICISLCK
jgi:hypothetical protein